MSDNRAEFRINAQGRAKINVPGQVAPIDCIVHNISPSGACLEFAALAVPIPELFAIVPDDGEYAETPIKARVLRD